MGRGADVAERSLGGTTIIEIAGDLDVSNADAFVDIAYAAAERTDARIVVDLARADFIDSTVLNVLFASAPKLRANGGDLAVVCTKDHLLRVVEASGLDRLYAIVATREEALAALGDPR